MTTLISARNKDMILAAATAQWHERCVAHMLRSTGNRVDREPRLLGKTPDLLVTRPDGQRFIVECVARVPPRGVRSDDDIRRMHRNVYSRVDHKATKYRAIADEMPYVIALYDGGSGPSPQVAMDLALSEYAPKIERAPDGRVKGRLYNLLWSMPEIPTALFDLYGHLSGLLYSTGPRDHHYLPNTRANRPLGTDAMPFAAVPEARGQQGRRARWTSRPPLIRPDFEGPPDWMEPAFIADVTGEPALA